MKIFIFKICKLAVEIYNMILVGLWMAVFYKITLSMHNRSYNCPGYGVTQYV